MVCEYRRTIFFVFQNNFVTLLPNFCFIENETIKDYQKYHEPRECFPR